MKTRYWLRYVEIALWIAIVVMVQLWSTRPAVLPRQSLFRAGMLFSAFLALAAIWTWRWWISRKTVDPRTRTRRRFALLAVGCLVCGGCYMARVERVPFDDVTHCQVLVGGGRVYVVVESLHGVALSSRLARFLQRPGRPPMGRMVSLMPTIHILESDGRTARSTQFPQNSWPGEFLPVGQHLYAVDELGDEMADISLWSDGKLIPLPAEELEKVRKLLADDPDDPCGKQGWDCTTITPGQINTFTRAITLNDRQVVVNLTLDSEKNQSTHVLHAKIEVPGAEPLVQDFPQAVENGRE